MTRFKEIKFEDMVQFRKGISYTSADYGSKDEGVPFITIKCLKKGGGYTSTGLKYFKGIFSQSDVLHKDDVLFSATDLTRDGDIVGSPLRVPFWGKEGKSLASMDLIKIEPNTEECIGDYIYYLLMGEEMRKKMVAFSAGSTVLHLDVKRIKKFKFNIPSKTHQFKIARILAVSDSVIEQTEKAIEKLKKMKQGMMHDLFTRGIDIKTGKLRPPYYEAPELYKETKLGWIPKEWDVVHIRDIASVKGGKRLPAGEEFSETPTNYPYIRVSDMKNGWVDMNDLVYVKPEIEQIIRNYKISKNDLYITIAGTLGQVGIIPDELDNAQLTENAAKIVFNELNEFNKQYVKCFFWSDLFPSQLFKEIGVGGGVPKLALHRIEKFLITNPSKSEQDVVSNRFVSLDNRLQCELNCLRKAKNIKQGLMQDLLTGKVEVTPDLQDKEHQEVS